MLAANKSIFEMILLLCTASYVVQILCDDNVTLENGDKPIIYKCCAMDEGFIKLENDTFQCDNSFFGSPSYTYVYDGDIEITNKSIEDVFEIKIFGKDVKNMRPWDRNLMPLETGEFLYKINYRHSFTRSKYLEKEDYCFEYLLQGDGFLDFIILIKVKFETDDTKMYFSGVGFLVSSFFLALVLVVYAMFSELRTLGGKVAMTCAASLLGTHSLQGSFSFLMFHSSLSLGSCVTLSTLVYFFFLATFFWMNVMSFDLWWTFRGLAKCRKINRRGEAFKYCMYSIYGWGTPLCLTIFMVLMNEYPPPGTVSPSIGDFKCYFGDLEQEIYMFVPMLILLICNCILFLMTVFNIWRSNKSSDMLRLKSSAAVKNSRNMFYVFLKMSIIMGISWVLEVVSFHMPNMKLLYITDAYNVLIGVAFFVIFVCKRRVLRLLKKKFKGEQQTKYSIASTSKHGFSQQ